MKGIESPNLDVRTMHIRVKLYWGIGHIEAGALELAGLGLPINRDQHLVPLMVPTVDGMSTGPALCPPPLLVTNVPVLQVFLGTLTKWTGER